MNTYWTETMEEILTSPEAKKIISFLSPLYGEARTALWLFQSIGVQLDDIRKWGDEYKLQTSPLSATWSLDYWEQEYNIPFDPLMSMQQRRDRITSRIRDRAPMNPTVLAQIASSAAANSTVEIEELISKNKFRVWITTMPGRNDEAKIRAEIDRAKPAHLIYDIQYVQNVIGTQYIGGIIQQSYRLTMKQV